MLLYYIQIKQIYFIIYPFTDLSYAAVDKWLGIFILTIYKFS